MIYDHIIIEPAAVSSDTGAGAYRVACTVCLGRGPVFWLDGKARTVASLLEHFHEFAEEHQHQ